MKLEGTCVRRYPALLGVLAALAACGSTAQAEPGGWKTDRPNLALHKAYTFSRAPNYSLCADPEDKTQLTDGVYTEGHFWTRKTTVGWSSAGKAPIGITVDLGQAEPLAGVAFSTAAGAAQVNWPKSILIFTSEDQVAWRVLGDLTRMDVTTEKPPAPDVYAVHRYATDRLATRGRYVMFVAESDHYLFCDEVEVYRSEGEPPAQARGTEVADPLDYLWRGVRLERDLDRIEARLRDAERLSPAERERAGRELRDLRTKTGAAFPPPPTDTPAFLPVNDLHARFFALNGLALRGHGMPVLFAWKKHRYDPLDPIELPDALPKLPPVLSIVAMDGEWRGDAVVLTNATERDMVVRVAAAGLPGGANLSVRDVPFVDSAPRVDAACPLPVAEGGAIRIPAGMNRQVWLMARPRREKPGDYRGVLRVSPPAQPSVRLEIPVHLRISPLRFPERPRMHLGGWDYTNQESMYDVVPTNRDRLVAYLRERYVDAPWATAGVLPMPAAEDFDDGGKLTKALDFSRVEEWVRRWTEPIPGAPGAKPARAFLIFLNGGKEFAGAKMDAPEFALRVASWTRAVASGFERAGARPDQVGLLIYDEPHSEEPGPLIRAWADAIHAAGTGIKVWEDPQYWEPEKPSIREVLEACDIVSPFVPMFFRLNAERREAYRGLSTGGRKLWFYNASGPVRALDPYAYHRLQHWLCFREGAEGSGFWAFGDAGGGSSWNERGSKRGSGYAPQYLAKDSVTDSKHMMGILEGVQDHEVLCLLRDRVQALEAGGARSQALEEAKALLQSAPDQVLAGLDRAVDREMLWQTPKDRSVADRLRERALASLEALGAR